MQNNNIVQKRQIEVDGVLQENLKSVSELKTAMGVVETASFRQKNDITDGSQKLEPVTIQYNRRRDGEESDFYYKWYNESEIKDIVVIITDGTGNEVERWLLPDCEISEYSKGEYDASTPDVFPVTIVAVCTGRFAPIE